MGGGDDVLVCIICELFGLCMESGPIDPGPPPVGLEEPSILEEGNKGGGGGGGMGALVR